MCLADWRIADAVLVLWCWLDFTFSCFAVDYTRTEYMQFEDDDYVYYVKAVPKVAVSKPDVRVQRMNNPERVRRPGAEGRRQERP